MSGLVVIAVMSGCKQSTTKTAVSSVSSSASPSQVSQEAVASARNSPRARPPRSTVKAVKAPKRVNKLTRTSGRVDGPIEYIVVEPARAALNAPLAVALHGWGDTPERFARLAEGMDMPVRTVVARGPQAGGRKGRAWFSRKDLTTQELDKAVSDLATLLKQLAARYPGAPKPVVYGFSQGGMLALELLRVQPDCCSGVAALSSSFVRPEPGVLSRGSANVLLSAGTGDTVVPPEKTNDAKERLTAAGHQVELLTFEGRHAVPANVRERLQRFVTKGVVDKAKKKPAQP